MHSNIFEELGSQARRRRYEAGRKEQTRLRAKLTYNGIICFHMRTKRYEMNYIIFRTAPLLPLSYPLVAETYLLLLPVYYTGHYKLDIINIIIVLAVEYNGFSIIIIYKISPAPL